MYQPYEHHESMDESPHAKSREDFVSASRSHKKAPKWVFISRRADIVIVLVMLLVSGLGIMWFISRLPFFLERALAHYLWAQEMYATWGTPSMRWLFINLVVGVIVATSGLLSAFGGDGGQEAEGPGYEKDRVYVGAHPRAYSTNEAAFSGPGYESPAYNPYIEPEKLGSHHNTSFGAWNYEDQERVQPREDEEEIVEDQALLDEPNVAPADVMSREIPVPREIPTPMSIEVPESTEIPISREISREVPMSGETPASTEMPMPTDIPVPRDVAAPEYISELEDSKGNGGNDLKGKEVEIISQVYDPIIGLDETPLAHGKFHRMRTDPSIHLAPVEVSAHDKSPPKPDILPKSHTFTIGRVIRRDQLVDFIEPFSRKLEGISRKIRLDPSRSFNMETVASQSSEISAPHVPEVSNPPPVMQAPTELAPPPPLVGGHRRRHSTESVPPVIPRRKERFPPEAFASSTTALPKQASTQGEVTYPVSVASKKTSPPQSPLLRQRSIVYPPALVSQASSTAEGTSSPPSPPMEKAIPPPPPPHLKLPPGRRNINPLAVASSEELPSLKFYAPPSASQEMSLAALSSARLPSKVSSIESKKPPSSKHTRPRSTHLTSRAFPRDGSPETSSLSVHDDQSLMVKPHRSSAGDQDIQEVGEGSILNSQQGPLPKDDDLHQQIEDFLARFHENWRLQRQESLARYKKRLLELDE